jgi:glutaredoxin domain-containing cysteine-rich protein 1
LIIRERKKQNERKEEKNKAKMGCISSKFICTADPELDSENNIKIDHVVSLKSSTYGALNLDRKLDYEKEEEKQKVEEDSKVTVKETKKVQVPILILPQSKKITNSKEEKTEVINAWEIMEGLEDDPSVWSPLKKPNKSLANLWSPKKIIRIKSGGKENSPLQRGKENSPLQRSSPSGNFDSNRVLRPFSSLPNSKLGTPNCPNTSILKKNQDGVSSSSRRSLVPLFDPDLIASIEQEFCREKEQIKQVVSCTPKTREADKLLKNFEEKCPPGGENALVLYTTTLHGIRKTFADCNTVRSAIESYGVQIMERDISMDSSYREELRVLLKEVKVPMLFVKGRLIGGVEMVVKLEEEGKLGRILRIIPKAKMCEGCAGFRFVMCKVCNGSCKVLEKGQNAKIVSEKGHKNITVKCVDCNENGLVKCPICC